MLNNTLDQHLGPRPLVSLAKVTDQHFWSRSLTKTLNNTLDQHLAPRSLTKVIGQGLSPTSLINTFEENLSSKSLVEALGQDHLWARIFSPISLINLLEQDHATRPALAKPRSFITIFDQHPGSTSLAKFFGQHPLLDQGLGHLWPRSMVCMCYQDHLPRCWTTTWANTLGQGLWCLWPRSLISIFGQGHWPRPWTTPWTNILPKIFDQGHWPRSFPNIFDQHLWGRS